MRTEPLPARHVLNGPTMGSRFAAVFYAHDPDLAGLQQELQQAVDRVDAQMSSWKPQSELMQLNRAPQGQWLELPAELTEVLAAAMAIGRATDGAFDIGVGDLAWAWGFGPAHGELDETAIGAALAADRVPAHLALELDRGSRRVRKLAPTVLDLSGIAKGFGVDELARVLEARGIARYLVSIDGEVRAGQEKPDGAGWRVAIESPEFGRREADGVVEIAGAALATSGDYRQVVERHGVRHAHTIDPARRAPLAGGPAAVTVLAPDCMTADAWATALLVLGPERGLPLAAAHGLEALFAEREAATA